ncbi:hypothetical protein [Tenacibaculum bernardetii]|uniref:hypothetical protein n=1 Tax=Tenacibaculum bernardetii TaxID=3021375 RepID=UPI0023AEF474|nr:hypothetical protein [Tenacibaculum bernardetii]
MTDFNLPFDKETDIDNSAIINGLNYFSEKWKLTDVIKTLSNWREKLWKED